MEGWAIIAAEVCPGSLWLAVVDGFQDRVALLNLPDLSVVASGPLAGTAMDVDVDPTGNHVYAITLNGNLWDWTSGTDEWDTLEVDLHPRRMALRPPDRLTAWVVSVRENTVAVVDLRPLRTVDMMPQGAPPSDVQFSADGRHAYVAVGGDSGHIAMYDASTRALLDRYDAGPGPFEIAISGDEQYLAASDSSAGSLSIWELNTQRVWTVALGAAAFTVRCAHDSHVFYVLSVSQSRITRISILDDGPHTDFVAAMPETARQFVLWEH